MPKIKIKLSRFEKAAVPVSPGMPGDRKANRGKASILLHPGQAPVEMEVSHEHLAYLIGDRTYDVEIVDKGEKIVPPEMRPKKVYEYPWQEAMDRRAEADKEYAEEQALKAETKRLEDERDEKLKQGIQPDNKPKARDTAPTR